MSKTRSFARFALWTPIAALGFAGTAQAAIVTISGGTEITTQSSGPGTNNVLGAGFKMQDNAAIATTVGNVTFQFYFLGSESGYRNTLRGGAAVGGGVHTEVDSYPGTWPGTLLFSGTTGAATASNQSLLYFTSSGFSGNLNPAGGNTARSIAFAYLNPGCLSAGGSLIGKQGCVSQTEILDANGYGYILFALDDSGAGPDDNHDDYVGYMRYQAAPVPIPAAAWLLGSGLIGLVVLSRRRRLDA